LAAISSKIARPTRTAELHLVIVDIAALVQTVWEYGFPTCHTTGNQRQHTPTIITFLPPILAFRNNQCGVVPPIYMREQAGMMMLSASPQA